MNKFVKSQMKNNYFLFKSKIFNIWNEKNIEDEKIYKIQKNLVKYRIKNCV
jgi:hypothetical protein